MRLGGVKCSGEEEGKAGGGCCHTMHCHAASLAPARTALRTHGAAHALRTHGSACGSLQLMKTSLHALFHQQGTLIFNLILFMIYFMIYFHFSFFIFHFSFLISFLYFISLNDFRLVAAI